MQSLVIGTAIRLLNHLRCEEDRVTLAVRVDADVGLVRLLVRHERLHDERPQFSRGAPDLQLGKRL